jgi:unsaturated chondroitin disaccharide hydrolase
VGAVKCCDWNPDWSFPVVVDTLVNLELLLWGAENGGEAAWRDQALAHALTSARDLVRADGGTFHVADYDAATAALRSRGTFQGAGDGTTWSRGQAWAMVGFTRAYRYTRDPRMLEAARKVTAYWLARAPAGGVPSWDFDAARVEPDSSAAAAAASALLELSALVGGAEGGRYRAAALAALDTLASDFLDRTDGEALLTGGVGDLPHGKEIGVGLVYGDHYFVEALLRAFPQPGACATPGPPAPPPAEPPPEGPPPEGPPPSIPPPPPEEPAEPPPSVPSPPPEGPPVEPPPATEPPPLPGEPPAGATPAPAPPQGGSAPAPSSGSGKGGGGCGTADGGGPLALLLAAAALARALRRAR